jgi:hypothetical protein
MPLTYSMIKAMQESFQVNHLNLQSSPQSTQTPLQQPRVSQQDASVEAIFARPQGAVPMKKQSKNGMFIILSILVILGGCATGFGVSKLRAKEASVQSGTSAASAEAKKNLKNGQVFGSQEVSEKDDDAEGYLQIGGSSGEGSHKLLRAGGEDQTVYLTSSTTDLDTFENAQVKVWGRTIGSEKVGWLMDVTRVEVVEVNGKAPADAK